MSGALRHTCLGVVRMCCPSCGTCSSPARPAQHPPAGHSRAGHSSAWFSTRLHGTARHSTAQHGSVSACRAQQGTAGPARHSMERPSIRLHRAQQGRTWHSTEQRTRVRPNCPIHWAKLALDQRWQSDDGSCSLWPVVAA